jgi:hypothetical protein
MRWPLAHWLASTGAPSVHRDFRGRAVTRTVLIAAVTSAIAFFAGVQAGHKDEVRAIARLLKSRAEKTRQVRSFCAALPTHYRCWMDPWDRDGLDDQFDAVDDDQYGEE